MNDFLVSFQLNRLKITNGDLQERLFNLSSSLKPLGT